jgi:serine/threonine protein kinase
MDAGARVGGKYVLLRRIAAGGMGDVWVARNETTDAHVALKILRPNRDVRTQADERFRREAKLGGLLGHRSIARIFDFLDESDGTLILVMELLRGETLENHLQALGPVPTREALAMMIPVLSALQHGHEHGVIHRDVKPANVFLHLEPDGRVIPKLLDFGIAKIPYSGTKTVDGLVLGTPSYMSPEQIRGEDGLDGRSDLFSVGVVLYELLTGTCPFGAPGASASIAAVLQGAVDPDPRIDPRLWVELQRSLAKRPAERHASAADMAAALCAAAGETEDGLGAVLKRAKPPPTLTDLTGPSSVVRQAEPPPPATVHTQSVVAEEEPSVAPAPRRVSRWAVRIGVLSAASLLALAAVVTVHEVRSSASVAPRARDATPVATAASTGADPAVAPVIPEPAGAASSATVVATPAASVSAPPPRATPSRHAPRSVPRKAPRVPPRPKSFASNPGF